MSEKVNKLVYVASPLRGDYKRNMELARQYCKYVTDQGFIPYAPHLLFTQFMDDTIPEEREAGMAMGREMLKRCDELWVFGETISEGMAAEIKVAKEIGIPILRITTTKAMKSKKETVAENIAGLRKRLGKKQKEVAEDLGINVNTLASYELGNREPNYDTLAKIADYYGASLDSIFGRTLRIEVQHGQD